jgi:hemolysin-activating ACP:hemolysin acyltransferase
MLALHVDPKLIDPDRYQTVGQITTILSASPYFKADIGKLVVEEILPAYRHGCVRIFYDMDSVPVGLITWAWLSDETEARLLRDMDPWLHLSEWNEGNSLWIRHFLVPPQQRIRATALCMQQLFPNVTRARTLTVRKGALTALEFDRDYLERVGRKAKNHWAQI